MSLTPCGQDKFIAIHGLQFHYVEWGTLGNPSLVLLHGFQSNAHTWDTFSQAMADTYHVLALDQRGHGDTSWAPDGDYAPNASVLPNGGVRVELRLRKEVAVIGPRSVLGQGLLRFLDAVGILPLHVEGLGMAVVVQRLLGIVELAGLFVLRRAGGDEAQCQDRDEKRRSAGGSHGTGL